MELERRAGVEGQGGREVLHPYPWSTDMVARQVGPQGGVVAGAIRHQTHAVGAIQIPTVPSGSSEQRHAVTY